MNALSAAQFMHLLRDDKKIVNDKFGKIGVVTF